MNVVFFTHSLASDWNHGNAHFLRGVVTELVSRGHEVRCYERRDAKSAESLVREHGEAKLAEVGAVYPALDVRRYDAGALDLDEALDHADLVLVHERNDPALVRALGERRAHGGTFRLLFHDTDHRSVSAPEELERYDLSGYDGALVFGGALARVYEDRGWGRRAFVWHEAADVRVFHPRNGEPEEGDLVWIGNWGEGERAAELTAMLFEPCRALRPRARVHGVRYPDHALASMRSAGITYGGWLPNYEVPRVFARHRVTVHIPRRFYRERLPGIPTIRPFEALACGIPLISAPWDDAEGLFREGTDYLVARDTEQMTGLLRELIADAALRRELSARGRETILARHTCAHRVDELLAIAAELGTAMSAPGDAHARGSRSREPTDPRDPPARRGDGAR